RVPHLPNTLLKFSSTHLSPSFYLSCLCLFFFLTKRTPINTKQIFLFFFLYTNQHIPSSSPHIRTLSSN
ncbi:MAG: hypothetical protein Q8823_00615, partial [Candidatus Phytoplasma australasiaticum]|nr:hypothetical protein [Candidatus Phytoplasma australasiaticum]